MELRRFVWEFGHQLVYLFGQAVLGWELVEFFERELAKHIRSPRNSATNLRAWPTSEKPCQYSWFAGNQCLTGSSKRRATETWSEWAGKSWTADSARSAAEGAAASHRCATIPAKCFVNCSRSLGTFRGRVVITMLIVFATIKITLCWMCKHRLICRLVSFTAPHVTQCSGIWVCVAKTWKKFECLFCYKFGIQICSIESP